MRFVQVYSVFQERFRLFRNILHQSVSSIYSLGIQLHIICMLVWIPEWKSLSYLLFQRGIPLNNLFLIINIKYNLLMSLFMNSFFWIFSHFKSTIIWSNNSFFFLWVERTSFSLLKSLHIILCLLNTLLFFIRFQSHQ